MLASTTKPEVLSPAGSPEALRAAIAAGCDSVYFGLTDYNARIRATNFELGDLPGVVKDLRRWGVKSCLTFNTLVFLEEERAARRVLEAIAHAGPDALIVQDLGAVRWIREIAPELEIHASTQATATSPDGVNLLQRLGISRAVLARELTLPEIAKVRSATTLELEVFVHGALCVSYSGQCLSSEAWGGRSANRGQCAQACRHPYDLLVDGHDHDLGDRAYLLSPRDLEGYKRIPELTALGISAFKIEGRMKSPEYVAAATALYRAAVDRAWNAALAAGRLESTRPSTSRQLEELAQRARQIYSRGASEGFLGGVNHQVLVDGKTRTHRGLLVGRLHSVEPHRSGRGSVLVIETLQEPGRPPVALKVGDGIVIVLGPREEDEHGGRIAEITPGSRPNQLRVNLHRDSAIDPRYAKVGAPVYRTASPEATAELTRFTGRPEDARQVPLVFAIEAKAGEPLYVSARDPEGRVVEARSSAPLERATHAAVDEAQLNAQLSRLGGTRYRLAGLECELEPDLFCPVSELNRLRRDLVHAMEELRASTPRRTIELEPTAAEAPTVSRELESPVTWAVARAEGSPTIPKATSAVESSHASSFEAQVAILCRDRAQVEAAVEAGARRIVLDFLDLVGLKDANLWLAERGIARSLALPRVQKPGEEKIEAFFLGLGPDEILVRNLGSVERLRLIHLARGEAIFPVLVGDTSLNAVNPASIEVLLGLGLARITPGFDLNGEQLLHLVGACDPTRLELPLHHHLPVFHTEHCVFAAFLSDGADYRSCGRPCDHHRLELRDRTGEQHPVVADVGCRNTVFSAKAQSAIAELPALRRAGVASFRLELMNQDRAATLWTIDTYRAVWEGRKLADAALAELRAEARYGVSTGAPEPSRKLELKPVGGRREEQARPRGGQRGGRPAAGTPNRGASPRPGNKRGPRQSPRKPN